MKTGIDLTEVSRFEKIASNLENSKFIFTDNEINYIKTKEVKNVNSVKKFKPVEYTIAGLYAAKEAVLKAFGVGIGNGIGLNEVEISHDSIGACVVNLIGKAKQYYLENNFDEISVNISHDGDYATAICIIK